MWALSVLVGSAARVLLVAVLCVVFFVAGGYIGVEFGALSARIDFCDDDTSGRFIADPAVSAEVCQPGN